MDKYTLIKWFCYVIIAVEIFADDGGHFEKNNALASIQSKIEDGTYKNKEEVLAALKQIKSYNDGVALEAIHDALGEKENTRNGYNDVDSGVLGFLDFFDFIPDRTIMEMFPKTNDGQENKEDAKISINWGKVTPVNFVINYEQNMQGILDYRKTVPHYIDPFTEIDNRDLNDPKPVYTEKKRILLPYLYSNYYANDPSKIIIESNTEEKDGKVIINSVIKVYQDSFSNIPSPDTTANEEVQFGFIFKEDPRRTEKEFEEAYKTEEYAWRLSGLNFDPEILRTRITISPNASSYYSSKQEYEKNRKKFENYRNQILKANNADATQVASAFFYYEFWNKLQSNIQQVKENKGVTTEVVTNTKIQVSSCKFEDREEHKEDYKTVKLEDISWPDRLQDMHKIRFDFPLVLPKSEYKKSTIMTETELDKAKRAIIDADTDLPQVKSGEESAEEVTFYTVYDWESIREGEKEEEQKNNGQASIQSPNYRLVYDCTTNKDYILRKKAETEKLPNGVSAREMVELYKKTDPSSVQAQVKIPTNKKTRAPGGFEI